MPTIRIGFNDTGSLSGQDLLVRFGPTIFVLIGFDPAYSPGVSPRPSLPQLELPALVDTGASESCIDSALAQKLELPAVDTGFISGVQGASETIFYLAQIYVPRLNWTIYGRFSGVHLTTGGQPHNALMGRDFLRNFVLTYEGRTGDVIIGNNFDPLPRVE